MPPKSATKVTDWPRCTALAGQRQVQIAAGQTIADGDNGNSVFNQIKTGNGTFNASAAVGNTGTGVLGASTVQNPAAYDGGTYAINFTAANTFEVRDSANALVTSGTYTAGQSIAFRGVQVTLNGQPATGDSFTVAPSTNQSVFTTVQNLVSALQTPGGGSVQATKKQLPGRPQALHAGPVNIPVRETSSDGPILAHVASSRPGSVVMSAGAVHVAVFEFFAGRFTHADHLHIEM
jgi:hypothetical protein